VVPEKTSTPGGFVVSFAVLLHAGITLARTNKAAIRGNAIRKNAMHTPVERKLAESEMAPRGSSRLVRPGKSFPLKEPDPLPITLSVRGVLSTGFRRPIERVTGSMYMHSQPLRPDPRLANLDQETELRRVERIRLLSNLRAENSSTDENLRQDLTRLQELRLELVRARLAVELDTNLDRITNGLPPKP